MADLLECLIQIKALESSIGRVESVVAEAPAAARVDVEAFVVRLADAERVYGRVGLGRISPDGLSTQALGAAAFIAERRANLAVLRACTADELASPVEWPGRRHTTVADLVAIMLAHDTDVIGELRRLAMRDVAPERFPVTP